MSLEPIAREAGDLFERARLFKEMRRAGDDDEVLLNLDAGNPSFFSRFCRLIEVAGTTPEEMQAARKRYRFYQDRGYEIRHHRLEFA